MLTPILAHTAEEAWAAMKFKSQDVETVHLAAMPQVCEKINTAAQEGKWDKIMTLRDDVLRTLEGLRQDGAIASNLEAAVSVVTDDDELLGAVNELSVESFAAFCIVSEVKISKGSENKVSAEKSSYEKCDRCWNYWPSVGKNENHPDLCQRCIDVIK
jgi:isoleucyl-tRNA synthetase